MSFPFSCREHEFAVFKPHDFVVVVALLELWLPPVVCVFLLLLLMMYVCLPLPSSIPPFLVNNEETLQLCPYNRFRNLAFVSPHNQNQTMSLLLVVVLLACIVASFGFLLSNPRIQPKIRTRSVAVELRKESMVAAVALISSMLLNTNGCPAFADLAADGEEEITMSVKVVGFSTVDGEKKSSKTTKATSETDDPDSYANSLKKEQKKQEARKKDKVSRSKDLCETLGRGC